jgi:hypothetical protein
VTEAAEADSARFTIRRIALAYSVFLAALIPFFLWVGRGQWFQFDDWDYLVQRRAGDLGDLLRPHNGHWEAVPVLVYRGLWSIFGLRYQPYMLVSIVASLCGIVLLLVIMLRARTRPWIAIGVATLLVLFGDGQVNVALRVTSITFVGFAVPLGFLHLILADHDGGLDRRDWAGLGVGFVALLCSNVATVMVLAVGIAMLVKRGWRIAAFHVLPLATVFVAWWIAKGRHDTGVGSPSRLRPLPSAVHFAWLLVTGTIESLSRVGGAGLVFGLIGVIGLVLALWKADAVRRREAVVPCALLLAAAFFTIETGLGRADLLAQGSKAIRQGHYMAAVAFLSLPALAFLAEETVRHFRRVAVVFASLLVVAIGANTHTLINDADAKRPAVAQFRNTVLAIPQIAQEAAAPRGLRPFKGEAMPLTVGWLLDAAAHGKLPRPREMSTATRGLATVHVSLIVVPSRQTPCRPFPTSVTRRLATRGSIRYRGVGLAVVDVANDVEASRWVPFRSRSQAEWQIVNVGRPLTLRFTPVGTGAPAPMLCN